MATDAGNGLRFADVVDLCVRVMPHAVVVVVGPAHSRFYIVDKSFKVSTAGGMRHGECVADPTALVNARGKEEASPRSSHGAGRNVLCVVRGASNRLGGFWLTV